MSYFLQFASRLSINTHVVLSAVVTLVALAAAPHAARAGDWQPIVTRHPEGARYEIASGAEAARDHWSLYASATMAIFGRVLEDGPRLRATAAYGAYRYEADGLDPFTVDGTMSFAEALIGYQTRMGPAIMKAFVGISAERHDLVPPDPDNRVVGRRIGPAVLLESWVDLTEQHFLSVDLAYRFAHDSYSGRLRWGERMVTLAGFAISAGPELAANGDRSYDALRAGAFARLEWSMGELGLSAGVAGNREQDRDAGGYLTLSAMVRH